jgi:hypothetical protein
MPSTYNNNLRLEMIANGEQSGTWGSTTNTNLGTLLVDAISGKASVTTATSPYTLTAFNGAADESRCAALELNTSTGANYIVIVPTVTKLYVVDNVNSTYSVTVRTASGSGIAIPPNRTALLRCDGTNVIEQLDYVVSQFGVGGNATVAGTLNVTGASTLTGAVGAPGGVTGNLTGNVTGNLTGNVSAGAGTINTTNYTFTEVGGVLFIKNGATNIAKIDASGNLTVIGNITAYGTV